MSETCIVCLGDLGENAIELPHHPIPAVKAEDDSDGVASIHTLTPERQSEVIGQEIIAHLLPCGHNLHDECLKPWVERANSCPICRQSFNEVELSQTVGGISTYSSEIWGQKTYIDDRLCHLFLCC